MSSTTLQETTTNGAAPAVDPVARLRAEIVNGIIDHRSPMSSLLVSERRVLYAFLDEIEPLVRDAVKAKEDKSAILDSLLGAALEIEEKQATIERAFRDRDRLAKENNELRFLLQVSENGADRVRQQAIEAERTINALTKLTPNEYQSAAEAFLGLLELTTTVGKMSPDPRAFFKTLQDSNAPTPSQLRESARRFREAAIAVERANDGVKAR